MGQRLSGRDDKREGVKCLQCDAGAARCVIAGRIIRRDRSGAVYRGQYGELRGGTANCGAVWRAAEWHGVYLHSGGIIKSSG